MHFSVTEGAVWPISLDFSTEQLTGVAMLLATLFGTFLQKCGAVFVQASDPKQAALPGSIEFHTKITRVKPGSSVDAHR